MRTSTRHPRLLVIAFTAMWVAVAFHGARALLGFGGPGLAAFTKNWVYTAAEVLAVAICAAVLLALAYFGLPGLRTIGNLEEAQAAVQFIVQQGEGSAQDKAGSHFSRFCAIRRE